MKIRVILTTLIVLSAALVTNAQTVEKKSLSIDGAKKVIAGAVAYAKKNNAPGGVIAVVDEGGNLMALERLDGTFAAGANISIGKARTAVLFKRPTKAFEDIIKNGRTAMVALPDAYFTPLQGGVPITIDGQIVGGVGVSGAASAQQDEEMAIAGANAVAGDMRTSELMPAKSLNLAHAAAKAAMINLGSVEGVKAVKGEWRYSDTKIVEADFRGPGPDNSRPACQSKLTTTRHTPAAPASTTQSGK